MATISQQVVVRISVQNGGQVQQTVNQIGTQGQAAFSGMSGAIEKTALSMGKMFLTIAAWKVLITIPRELAEAFGNFTLKAIESADEMNRAFITSAAVLTTFTQFDDNLTKSFNIAIDKSKKLQVMFAQLSGTGVASIEDMQKVFEIFVSRGGLATVPNDLQKAANVTALLANAILTLTQGQQKERQLVSETSNFLSGQVTANNILARLVASQVGNLKTWVEKRKQLHDMDVELPKVLSGFVAMGDEASKTLFGMYNQILGMLELLNNIAMNGGALHTISELFSDIRATIKLAIDELIRGDLPLNFMAASTQNILFAFGLFNEIIKETIDTFSKLGNEIASGGAQEAIRSILMMVLQFGVLIKTIVDKAFETYTKIASFLGINMQKVFSAAAGVVGISVDYATNLAAALKSINDSEQGVINFFKTLQGIDNSTGKGVPGAPDETELRKQAQLWEHVTEQFRNFQQLAKETGPLNEVEALFNKIDNHVEDLMHSLEGIKDKQLVQTMTDAILANADLMLQNGIAKIRKDWEDEWAKERSAFHGGMNLKSLDFSDQITQAMNHAKEMLHISFKQIADDAKLVVDANQAFFESFDEVKELLPFSMQLGLVNERIAASANEIKVLNAHIKYLGEILKGDISQELRETLSSEVDKSSDAILRLRKEIKQLQGTLEAFPHVESTFGKLHQDIHDLVNAIIALKNATPDTVNDALLKYLKALQATLGDVAIAMGETFAQLLTGATTFKQLFRKILGELIVFIGEYIIACGAGLMAKGWFLGNPAAIAKGIALMALGGFIIGLGKAVGASGGSSKGSSNASGGVGGGGGIQDSAPRTIFLSLPASNTNNTLVAVNSSLNRLNGHLDRMDTMSPGAVVMKGTKEAGVPDQILSVTTSAMKGNQKSRNEFVSTVKQDM